MAYGDFKDLKKRTFSDKVSRDKAFNIASMVYNFFDKKSTGGGVNTDVKHNEELVKELHKAIIRNF